METSTCRSCGARIVWAETENGKRMPIDAKPEKRLVLIIDPPSPGTTPLVDVRDTYVSHFATCPNAAQHRKAR